MKLRLFIASLVVAAIVMGCGSNDGGEGAPKNDSISKETRADKKGD